MMKKKVSISSNMGSTIYRETYENLYGITLKKDKTTYSGPPPTF